MSPTSSNHERRAQEHDKQFGIPVEHRTVYAPFAAWLDGELKQLVDRWSHLAAPSASRREQALRRLSRP